MRALITGATGGIGLATAMALGKAGYEIIITGRTQARGDAALTQLFAQGIPSYFYLCDAMDENSVNSVYAQIEKDFGSIDVLINNVGGLGGRQRISDMDTDFMRKVMALNFDSVFFSTRAALPMLKKGENASIINFSTIAVTSGGGPGASIYSAAKGAVQSFTRGLAKDLAEFGIRVNMVSPGIIDTPFHSATDPKIIEGWKKNILMGRLGTAEEVASVIEFLVSPKASFITGEVIQINGGQTFI